MPIVLPLAGNPSPGASGNEGTSVRRRSDGDGGHRIPAAPGDGLAMPAGPDPVRPAR